MADYMGPNWPSHVTGGESVDSGAFHAIISSHKMALNCHVILLDAYVSIYKTVSVFANCDERGGKYLIPRRKATWCVVIIKGE
jgi:hypothetical protein